MTATATPAVTTNPSKALVDRMTPEQVQAEVNALLEKLRKETNLNTKKKIRRALRTRGYYLSRLATPEAKTPEPPKPVEAPKAEVKAEVKDDVKPAPKAKGKKGKK